MKRASPSELLGQERNGLGVVLVGVEGVVVQHVLGEGVAPKDFVAENCFASHFFPIFSNAQV